MKKSLFILIAFMGIFLFSGCKTSKVENTMSEGIYGDTIVLEGNASTGYSWECVESVPGLVTIEENTVSLGSENMVGAPSLYKFKLIPVKDGDELLIFMYRRSWEKSAPLKSKQFNVSVKGSKVTITEN